VGRGVGSLVVDVVVGRGAGAFVGRGRGVGLECGRGVFECAFFTFPPCRRLWCEWPLHEPVCDLPPQFRRARPFRAEGLYVGM